MASRIDKLLALWTCWPTGTTVDVSKMWSVQHTVRPAVSVETLSKLTDPGYQKGIAWRMDKMQGIIEAWQQGKDDAWIIRVLVRSGVTQQKARELIQAAKMSESMSDDMHDAHSTKGEKDAP